jgi:FixJ family two-component response regulator
MTNSAGVVFVVDDDASMRESLKNLIRSVGLRVEPHALKHEASSQLRARHDRSFRVQP